MNVRCFDPDLMEPQAWLDLTVIKMTGADSQEEVFMGFNKF